LADKKRALGTGWLAACQFYYTKKNIADIFFNSKINTNDKN